ncbi:MAG: GTP-binding protein, partial [Lachnospiraceae bacterium]|nr:GTP-binding protein [Lachnospiraceae bacterium]
MKVYETKDIRNVAVLGHGSAGKTTIVEAAAFVTGVISRMGKVTDGSTISDFDKEEVKRGFSLSTAVVPIEWEGKKINLLDTPGYFDFVGEAEEAVSAADAAVIVVNGKAGVQVGVQKAWDLCEAANLPRLFFVTNMDDDNANYARVCEELKNTFGTRVVPFQVPIRENEKLAGFVNVPKMSARRFTGTKGEYEECAIPDSVKDLLEETHGSLMEAVAETDEELMERYFEGDEFTPEEISNALNSAVVNGDVIPVLMGSGLNGYGVRVLLHDIEKYFPSPADRKISGKNVNTDEEFAADYDDTKPVTAKVFKTLIDPFIGKYSFIKVCSGVLKGGDTVLYDVQKETEEKIARVYLLRGKEAIEVPELHAGDIGALAKAMSVGTGDSLASKAAPIEYPQPAISKPYTSMAYRAVKKGDDDKIATSLAKLMEEDLTIKTVNDKENRQLLLYG